MAEQQLQSKPTTFGGWLWVLEIVLALTFLGQTGRVIYSIVFTASHWNTIVTRLHHPTVQALLTKQLMSLFTAAAVGTLLWFLSKASRWFPKLAIVWFCGMPFVNLAYFGTIAYLSRQPGYTGPRVGAQMALSLGLTTLVALLWTSYILRSPRVSSYFTSDWPLRSRSVPP